MISSDTILIKNRQSVFLFIVYKQMDTVPAGNYIFLLAIQLKPYGPD